MDVRWPTITPRDVSVTVTRDASITVVRDSSVRDSSYESPSKRSRSEQPQPGATSKSRPTTPADSYSESPRERKKRPMKAAGGFLSKLDEVRKKKILARLQKIFQSNSAPDIEEMSDAEATRHIRAISEAHNLDDEVLRALNTVTVKKMMVQPKAEQPPPRPKVSLKRRETPVAKRREP